MQSTPSSAPDFRRRPQDTGGSSICATPIWKSACYDDRRLSSGTTGSTTEISMTVDSINRIPVEILSEIFLICAHTFDESERARFIKHGIPPEHYRPVIAPKATPYTLSSVCKRWRSIGLSTPKLWSKFIILGRLPRGFEKSSMVTLETWLERSKDCPLQFSCLAALLPIREQMMITAALFDHIHRWSIVYFDLNSSSAFPARLSRDLLKAEKLDTLECRSCKQLLDDVPLLRLPSLRRLAIYSDHLTVEKPGCLNVTHLALTASEQVTVTNTYPFFENLPQFPSLISFEVSIRFLSSWIDDPPPNPITHMALTELIIDGYAPNRPLKRILTNICLLKIRRLRLTGIPFEAMDIKRELHDVVNDFICRHELTFSDLEISGRHLSSNTSIKILHMFPKYLVSCHFDLSDLADEDVKKLTLNPSKPSQDLAPNLSHLSFRILTGYHYYYPGQKVSFGRLAHRDDTLEMES